MTPVRRYLRISRYCVLETRIHCDGFNHSDSWLLGGRQPAIDRIFAAIRPVVRCKLREENEKARVRGKKTKKTTHDVVTDDDFEVTVFMTEQSTRHSILRRQRNIRSKRKSRLVSNTGRLTEWLNPARQPQPGGGKEGERPGDQTGETNDSIVLSPDSPILVDDNDDDGNDDGDAGQAAAVPGSPSSDAGSASSSAEREGSKKTMFETTYAGFSIYGRILTLVVKRIDPSQNNQSDIPTDQPQGQEAQPETESGAKQKKKRATPKGRSKDGRTVAGQTAEPGRPNVLETWISTQVDRFQGGDAPDDADD